VNVQVKQLVVYSAGKREG